MNSPLIPTRGVGNWPAPQYLDVNAGHRLIHRLGQNRSSGMIVQFLAASTGEGTSTLVRDLALVAARLPGLRVLVLDFDPSGESQMTVLRDDYGLAVLGTESAGPPGAFSVNRLALGGLHVTETMLPPGDGGPALVKLFPVLRPHYDLVLIDSPALDRSYDGIMLAPAVDTNLLVVEAEKTRSPVAQNLRDRILEVCGPIGGVVLNKQRFYIPRFIYRHI